ncbi:MAG: glycoside hydrolase, partial [Actinomycetota bacterium]|nr:glycoside hydrolase [Actinomycetota bacterium]
MNRFATTVGGLAAALMAASVVSAAPPQATQSDAAFAASYAANGVVNVSATTQKVSCYAPEVPYLTALTAAMGYPGGGETLCPGATTGEQTAGFATQDVSNPALLVKDHSESDLRVDPADPLHLIGQSKWFVSAEGYNHLLGFYESWDGGATWPVQGHVPGYEGWTDNTDPVGAFDPWGNFYSLILPYVFVYNKSGGHVYNNGSKQANPALPPEAISVAVHPAAPAASQSASNWITTHDGHPDYVFTVPNASTNTPDKQWIAIDTNPSSPHYGRVYAMFTQFVLNPSRILLSYADARPDGTHTDWSAPQVLPTIPGHPWDTYLLPHVAPDGTVYTTVTNNPVSQGFLNNAIYLISSHDGGVTWQGPTLVIPSVLTPTYRNTTFTEGIVNSFGLGTKQVNGHWPLYVAYENEDPDGFSRVYVTGSLDGGVTWSAPIRVNDGPGDVEALQPRVEVAPSGTVAVAFYDRRLACPSQDDVASGVQHDPFAPAGQTNFCVNTAIQFYKPNLTPVGHNIRLSQFTWDPQLNAPKRS